MSDYYNEDLPRTPANFQPLTPLTFLERAANVFPQDIAIIHGDLRRSYAEFYARSRQLASRPFLASAQTAREGRAPAGAGVPLAGFLWRCTAPL